MDAQRAERRSSMAELPPSQNLGIDDAQLLKFLAALQQNCNHCGATSFRLCWMPQGTEAMRLLHCKSCGYVHSMAEVAKSAVHGSIPTAKIEEIINAVTEVREAQQRTREDVRMN